MAQAKHDDSRETAGLAWDATNSLTKQLLVDPITGRLLLDVTLVADYVEVTHSLAEHDDNHIPSVNATTDDASATAVPLLVDNSTNYLLIDLVVG